MKEYIRAAMLTRVVTLSAVLCALFAACDPTPVDVSGLRYHCSTDADCVAPNRCVEGECTTRFGDAGSDFDAGGSGGGSGGGAAMGGGGGTTGGSGGGGGTTGGGGGTGGGGTTGGGGGGGTTGGGSAGGGGGDVDAGEDAGLDAGVEPDAGEIDAGTDAGTSQPDAGTVDDQIAAVRSAADQNMGGGLQISGALVTYLKPLVPDAGPDDRAGFFVQGSASGSAIFVALDPATVVGGPVTVGDLLDLQVQTAARLNGVREITALSSLNKTSSGNPVSGRITTIDGLDFTQGALLESLESRLVSVTTNVTGEPLASQSGYQAVSFDTTGTRDAGLTLRLRVPTALMSQQALGPGCNASVTGVPMWRSGGSALPSAWLAGEFTNQNCPAPTVTSAAAPSPTRVRVAFSRDLLASSVTSGAFTIAELPSGSLPVLGATPLSARTVELTTAAQTPLANYSVTVANSVLDTRNTPLSSTANTANFTGATCAPSVVISQVYGRGGGSASTPSADFVELHNRTASAVNIGGWSLQYASATNTTSWNVSVTFPANTMLQGGGYFLIRMVQTGTGVALPMPDATSNTDMSQSAGKLLIANNNVPVVTDTTGCPTTAAAGAVVDLVGYGTTANCREGVSTADNASPHTAATDAMFRRDATGAAAACTDTGLNQADFVTAPVAPRNSASPTSGCTCQ